MLAAVEFVRIGATKRKLWGDRTRVTRAFRLQEELINVVS